jgi:hypothetical protein
MFNDGILGIGFGCDLAQFLQNYNNTRIGIFYYGVICAHFYKITTTQAKAPCGCGGGLGLF